MNIEFDKKKERIVTMRATETEYKKLEEICNKFNVTKTSVLRALLNNYYDKEFKKE